MNERKHQNFLLSDSDDDIDFPVLYEKIHYQISLPDFLENQEEISNLQKDDIYQFKMNKKKDTNNDIQQDIQECKNKVDDKSNSTSFNCSGFPDLKRETFQNSNQNQKVYIFNEHLSEDIILPNSFFIISDIYYNEWKRTRNEITLRLYNLPYYESNYIVHLKERWSIIDVKVNDPILIISSFTKTYYKNNFSQQKFENTFDFNYEATIDNKNGFLILWPYFMISATRLSGTIHCMRQSVLISMVPYSSVQPNWILNEGTIAHSLVENVLTRKVESTAQIQNNVNELIEINISENGPQGISRQEMTDRLGPITDLAGKLSTNFQNQEKMKSLEANIQKLLQKQKDNQNQLQNDLQLEKLLNESEVQNQIEILQRIEQERIEKEKIEKQLKEHQKEKQKLEILKQNNINFPPYGCKVINNEDSLISLDYSYVGKSDLTLFDSEKQKYLPLEMKSGKSLNKKPKKHHQIQLSTYVLMMKEMYHKKATDYGMLFYMNDQISFKIQPTFSDHQSFAILRNYITENSIHLKIPPKIENKESCKICQAIDICKFIRDIEDIELGNVSEPKKEIKTKNKNKNKKKTKSKSKKKSQKNHNHENLANCEINEFLASINQDNSFLQNQISLYKYYEKLNDDKKMNEKEKEGIFIDIFDEEEKKNMNVNEKEKEEIFIDNSDDFSEDEKANLNEEIILPHYNQSQINFYKKIQKEINDDIREKGYNQYFNWTLPVEERERKGISINGLELLQMKKDQLFFFISEKFPKSKFRVYSKFVVTRNGKPPILNTGMIKEVNIEDESIFYVDLDNKECLHDGDSNLCIDLINFITDNTFEIHNLIDLFVYSSTKLKNITSFLIENERSRIIDHSEDLLLNSNKPLFCGMNDDQKTAIMNSIISKDYSVISGCKSSGKTLCLASLVHFFKSENKSVLIICPSDSSVDKMSDFLLDVLPFVQVKGQVIFLKKAASIEDASIFITSVKDFENSIFFQKKFDILIVDDCERIKMSSLIGPMNSSKKFIFCGDIFQSKSNASSIYSFLNIERNNFNFLRTKYNKSRDIHIIENSIIYNNSTYKHFDYFSDLEINLSRLNDFHQIHKNWLIPILSSSTFFIDTDDYNLNKEAAISAALSISLQICNMKPDLIGILCFNERMKFLIEKAMKYFLSLSDEFPKNETVNLCDIHNFSNYDYLKKNYDVLIVCFGKNELMIIDDIRSALLKANKKLYLIGKEKEMHANPILNDLIMMMNGEVKISPEVFKRDEIPFKGMLDLIA